MKAILYTGSVGSAGSAGRVRLDPAQPEPKVAEGDALVTIRRCALLADDLAAAEAGEGEREGGAAARIPGAMFVGVAGADTSRPRRVTSELRNWCGACERCRGGLRQYCASGRRLGSVGRSGVMSERCVLSAESLVEIPDGVDDDHAIFAPLVAVALSVQRLAGIPREFFVTVLGDGAQGLIVAQLLSRGNARVRVLGTDSARMGLCERWGIAHRPLDDAGRRGDQEIVIECTGTQDGLMSAAGLVRPRGTVIVAGGAATQRVLPPLLIRSDVTLHCAGSGSIREAIDVLARSAPDVVSLIGARFGPAEAAARLARGAVDPGGLLDVVVFAPG